MCVFVFFLTRQKASLTEAKKEKEEADTGIHGQCVVRCLIR